MVRGASRPDGNQALPPLTSTRRDFMLSGGKPKRYIGTRLNLRYRCGCCEAEPLIAELERFPDLYQDSLIRHFFHRLGIQPGERAQSLQFLENCIQAMAETATENETFFFYLRYG